MLTYAKNIKIEEKIEENELLLDFTVENRDTFKMGGSHWGDWKNGAENKCRDFCNKITQLNKDKYKFMVLVPSAFKGRTDDLIRQAKEKYPEKVVEGKLEKCPKVDAIVGRGEIEVSKKIKEYLESRGQKVKFVNPFSYHFPIRADEKGNVYVEKSLKRLDKLAKNCKKKEQVLVIAGFIGRLIKKGKSEKEGIRKYVSKLVSYFSRLRKRVVTLGRNGTDYSAALVAAGVGSNKIIKLGAAPGVTNGNGGYLTQIYADELLKNCRSEDDYCKVDAMFHPKGLKLITKPRSKHKFKVHVTNDIEQYIHGNVRYGTLIQ